jgi:type II secretory ATPase GspE/PulE/Tfp pilus assembly ATPase PilB-like protein
MICPKCKQTYTPSPEEIELLDSQKLVPDSDQEMNTKSDESTNKKRGVRKNKKNEKEIFLYRGKGCEDCYNSGYSGRGAIYEILCASQEIRRLITNADSDEAIKQQAIAQGMKTLRQDGIEQVLTGGTTLDELLRVVDMRSG